MQLAYRRSERKRDTGNAQPVLVFLHAFPVDGRMWRRQLEFLGKRWEAVAIDFRGYGSSVPAGNDEFSMQLFADDVMETLDAMRPAVDRAVFVGCSMGGYVTFEIWKRHGDHVAGLVLCDTRAEGDSDEARKKRATQIERLGKEGSGWLAEEMSGALVADRTKVQRPELIGEIRGWMERASPDVVSRTLSALAGRQDSTAMLPKITVPTLVVVGEDDRVTPRELSETMKAAIPASELAVIPEAGHLAPTENAGEVNRAIEEWLARHF